MSLISKFFGNVNTGDLAYLRDSHLASFNFGQTNNYQELNSPRFQFLYFVRIDFNPELAEFTGKYFKPHDLALFIPLVKSVDQPTIKVETDVLNQYNKKRIHQKALKFNPIKLTFHDVADGKTLRLWEMYYEYYYRNGVNGVKVDPQDKRFIKEFFNRDTVSGNFQSGDSGYNLARVGNIKNLFDSVSIYQVNGGNYSKSMAINPIITDFSPSNMSFSKDELCEHVITFEYEDVVYYNYIEPLQNEDLEVFGNSNIKDLEPTKPRIPIVVENRSGTGAVTAISNTGQPEDDSFFGKIAGALGTGANHLISDLLNVGTNMQRDVGSLVNSLPGIAASGIKQGLLTGEFKFPVNLKSAVDNILDQRNRQIKGAGVRAFGAVVEGTVGAATDIFSDVFLDDDRVKALSLEEAQAIKAQQGSFKG